MESVARPRFRVGGSSLDGNRFECPKGDECSYEGLRPWPTSRSTQYHLARSAEKASHKRDKLVTKTTGYEPNSLGA